MALLGRCGGTVVRGGLCSWGAGRSCLRSGLARRSLIVLVVIVRFTRVVVVGSCSSRMGCTHLDRCRWHFEPLGGEELRRAVECLVQGFVNRSVNGFHAIVIIGLSLLSKIRTRLAVVGLLPGRKAIWDAHYRSVAVGVVAWSLGVFVVVVVTFVERVQVVAVLFEAAEDAAMCAVLVESHGCWLVKGQVKPSTGRKRSLGEAGGCV